jgi:hypothetical protein
MHRLRPGTVVLAVLLALAAPACTARLLPPDWPIAALTLPRGAVARPLPEAMQEFKQGESTASGKLKYGRPFWFVAFGGKFAWDDVLAHVQQQLVAEGYQQHRYAADPVHVSAQMTTNFSPCQGDMEVQVGLLKNLSIDESCEVTFYYYIVGPKPGSGGANQPGA